MPGQRQEGDGAPVVRNRAVRLERGGSCQGEGAEWRPCRESGEVQVLRGE